MPEYLYISTFSSPKPMLLPRPYEDVGAGTGTNIPSRLGMGKDYLIVVIRGPCGCQPILLDPRWPGPRSGL